MPKIKTHKATAKRYRVTKRGKIMRMKVGRSHLRRRKAKRTKRVFSQKLEVTHPGDKRRIKRLVPSLKK